MGAMLQPWALQPGTSAVDWCEGNYRISPVIAEFVNTVSNILFLVFPPLLTTLFKQYAEVVNKGIYIIWGLFGAVGLSSAYFHATLSMMGQLLDELSILWLIMAAFALWVPRKYIPHTLLNKDRKTFQRLMLFLCIVGTLLSWVNPAINAFALMGLGIPATYLLVMETKNSNNGRLKRLGWRCAGVWLLALACWINDRLFCEVWSAWNFPYLHGAWHMLICIAAYTACVIFAFIDAHNEVPEKLPVLKFWPSDRFELGVPYVVLKNSRGFPKRLSDDHHI